MCCSPPLDSFVLRPALTSPVPLCPCRSCPCHHSELKAALCPPLTPPSPAKRSPACVQTCPVVRSHHLPCRRPAREPRLHLQPHLRSPSTGIPAGPQTRRAPKESRLCSDSASYRMTPPSGMWKKFTTSSDHCQVRGGQSTTETWQIILDLQCV